MWGVPPLFDREVLESPVAGVRYTQWVCSVLLIYSFTLGRSMHPPSSFGKYFRHCSRRNGFTAVAGAGDVELGLGPLLSAQPCRGSRRRRGSLGVCVCLCGVCVCDGSR